MFAVDVMSRKPVYEQIVDQTERLVLLGLLQEGEQLPSVRGLSVSLSINPNTIAKAYSELDNHGVLTSVPGRGCFVAEGAVALLRARKRDRLSELEGTLRELKLAGVSRQDLESLLDRIFQEEGQKT